MKDQLLNLLPRLRRFAFSLTGSMADADDLVQATAERLLSRATKPQNLTNAYVFTICKNLWIDDLRKRRTRVAEEFTDSGQIADDQPPSEFDMEQHLQLQQLLATVEKLPEQAREVLSMVAIAGFSYAEAADILEVPVGTIMSRISRARKMLAERMNKPEPRLARPRHELH